MALNGKNKYFWGFTKDKGGFWNIGGLKIGYQIFQFVIIVNFLLFQETCVFLLFQSMQINFIKKMFSYFENRAQMYFLNLESDIWCYYI